MALKTLLSIVFNNKLSKKELNHILLEFKKVTFRKNEFLLKEGQTAKRYFLIEEGFLRSFAIDPNGNDTTTGFYSKNQLAIDWPSFLLQIPAQENIQAITDCDCWSLSFETFQKHFHSIESFREAGRDRLVGSYFSLKKKSIAMITTSAKGRYLFLLKENPELIQKASLKHIATYLGITDTSLSRIRKEIDKV